MGVRELQQASGGDATAVAGAGTASATGAAGPMGTPAMKPYYEDIKSGIVIYHGVDNGVRPMIDCSYETRAKEGLQAECRAC